MLRNQLVSTGGITDAVQEDHSVFAFIASQSCRAAVLTCRPRVRVRAGNPGYAGELKAKVDAEVERIKGDPALQARVKEMVAAARAAAEAEAVAPAPPQQPSSPSAVSQLMALGFDEQAVRAALSQTGGDVPAAAEWLLAQPPAPDPPAEHITPASVRPQDEPEPEHPEMEPAHPEEPTFASSAFKASFDSHDSPEFQHELLGAVYKLIIGYCKVHGLPEEKGKTFFTQVRSVVSAGLQRAYLGVFVTLCKHTFRA